MPLLKILITFLILSVHNLTYAQGQNDTLPSSINIVTEIWPKFTNKDGSGYYFELLRKVYWPLGVGLNIHYMPYSRAVAELRQGKADVLLGTYDGLFPQPWRSKYPVEQDNLDAALSPELFANWQGTESLNGKRVVAGYGGLLNQFYNLNVEYLEVRSVDSMLKMLRSGRVDAVLDYKLSFLPAFERLGVEPQYIKESVLSKPLYFIFYDSEKGKKLKAIFDLKMELMIKSGEVKQLLLEEVGEARHYPNYGFDEN